MWMTNKIYSPFISLRGSRMGGLLSTSKRIEKRWALFSSKIYTIKVWVPSQIYMYLLQYLLSIEGRYVTCYVPYERKWIVYCASSKKIMHLPKKVCPFRRTFQHITQLCSQITLALFVNMCLYSSLCHESKWEEWRIKTHLLPNSLIYLWSIWR